MEAIPNGQDVNEGYPPPPRKLIANDTRVVDMTRMRGEILDTEGLTPEDYKRLTTSLAAVEQPADNTGVSERPQSPSTSVTLEELGISKKDIIISRMLYLWYHSPRTIQLFAATIHSLQIGITLMSLSGRVVFPYSNDRFPGHMRLYLRQFRIEFLPGPGHRLTWEIMFACLNYIFLFANRGLLIEFVSFVFGTFVLMLMIAIEDPEMITLSDGSQLNVMTLDTNGPARANTASTATRAGRLGYVITLLSKVMQCNYSVLFMLSWSEDG